MLVQMPLAVLEDRAATQDEDEDEFEYKHDNCARAEEEEKGAANGGEAHNEEAQAARVVHSKPCCERHGVFLWLKKCGIPRWRCAARCSEGMITYPEVPTNVQAATYNNYMHSEKDIGFLPLQLPSKHWKI